MAATVNEHLQDATIHHAIDLHYYSNDVVRRIIALLNRTDIDLFAQLSSSLETMDPESFTVERLQQLLVSVQALNAQAYQAVSAELTTEMQKLVEYESGYQFQLFRSTIPPQIIAQVTVAQVNVDAVYSAAMARPFQGVLLKEALAGLEQGRAKLIRDAVRIGYVENQTTSEIVKRIRGTRARNYSDGLMEAPRRHIESITRTALSHTAGFTRDRFMKANADLVKAVEWVSTLDSKTSEGCRLRDGLHYTNDDAHKPIGHKVPWLSGPGALHWCCRSTSVPITKSWKELGGVDIGEFSASTRASMGGEVPAETTYAEWIKKQSASRQDDILGPSRGKLLRDGGLELDRFYSDRGRYLTLDQIRLRDAAAFARAGL